MKEQQELLEFKKIIAAIRPENRKYLHKLTILNTVDSTNTYLLTQAKELPSGAVCFAEEQTQGRGRQGRVWFSPYASNLYCSLSWRFPRSFAGLSALSMACAVMIFKALQNLGPVDKPRDEGGEEQGGGGLGIKWPNDLLFAGRKLSGILLENRVLPEHNLVVIGIGLNLHLPEAKKEAWIGVEEVLAKPVSRNEVAGVLLDELLSGISQFEAQGLQPFLPLCREQDLLLGKEVQVQTPAQSFFGKACGLNEQGELKVLDQEGQEHCFCYGEVSLRAKS